MKHITLFENFIVNEDEKKPLEKKKSEMSKDEKISMYRSKVAKERKNAAPDQSKIDEFTSEIKKLQKSDKPKKD